MGLLCGPTDLVALVQEVVTTYELMTDLHEFHVVAHLPELVGSFDPAGLRRVLANLLSNAVKYSPNGGAIDVCILRGEGPTRSYAELLVRDQGLGIPAADLPLLFQPFHRGSNLAHAIDGTGLGLASVRETVEHLGGTVSVVSEEGHGSTFGVRLPLAASPAETEGAYV